MYVIPVAYYVVKPDGGLQQSGPRIEVVGNNAMLRHPQGQQGGGYYYDQQQNNMVQPYYNNNNNLQYANQQGYNQGWNGAGYPAGYNNNNNNNNNNNGYPQVQNQQQTYYQPQPQPQYQGGAPMYQQKPTGTYYQQQKLPQNYNAGSGNNVAPQRTPAPQQQTAQQQQQFFPQTPTVEFFPQKQPQNDQKRPPSIHLEPTGSRPGSRTGSLERQRQKPSTGGMQIEIPSMGHDNLGVQGPLSAGSLPPSYEPSPRHREFREAMEQPVCPRTPPPRQLFELPYDRKKDPPPPQNVRHVRPQDLVPPEVIQMYSGRREPQPPQQQFDDPNSGSQPNFSRSNSLRRSQQFSNSDERRRAGQQPPTADIVKPHLSLSSSREHLGPPSMLRPQRPRQTQHYAEPINSQSSQLGVSGQETAQLVRHVPPEEAARLPQELFEEKPKWQPLRPDKFSIFGKEAAYPPFPVIGPRYLLSVSGGAKVIEILLSICVLVLVTIICDRGRCFPRMYIPMATEVVMWIVGGCAIIGTVFIIVPYARKKPLSPKAYYRFLLIEVVLTILGAFSYFVASISLLVIKEGEVIGYLIETWVCSAALGLVCGILYVCSAVFAYLALQRAKYYLDFLRYASSRHREDTGGLSYRMSVHPNPIPAQQIGRTPVYNRPPTSGGPSGTITLNSRYNNY